MDQSLFRDGVKLAVATAGGPAILGRHLGITSQAISQWRRVPAERVLAVVRATGLPPHRLRPDLYERPRCEHE